ncbi:hypothetical protein P3X46_016286 [Hevea brasiliensis]|uniref:Uncharacterized protein n=1 Tax=Hevea brasiliensis TaxID=3981 RepID=A0ABQ9M111_HEVBR|nr:hypothetical protein P3X46_016286 [Hevea brasiliensis]
MEPATNSPSTFNLWHSPIPYLFGSLALMLMIIAVSLIILACSYCKHHSARNEGENPRKSIGISGLEAEPKIVVIMAGDKRPRYLATPVTIFTPCNCEQV